MEDSILDNLPHIEWNILDDGEVEQGALGSHLTHIRRRDKTRSDEVVPNFGNVSQMLGLEIDRMARTVDPPLTPAFGQHADDLRVIGVLTELIKGARWHMLQAIETIDRLRTEVDQYTSHPDLFEDVGGEVSVEFPHHAHRRRARGLAQGTPPLSFDRLPKKFIGVMKPLLLNEDRFLQIMLNRSAALAFAKREASNVGVGSSLGRLRLVGNFCLLPDIVT